MGKIEVGEIFCWNDCFSILIKLGEKESMMLASDSFFVQNQWEGEDYRNLDGTSGVLCKLPKSVQRLWKEE